MKIHKFGYNKSATSGGSSKASLARDLLDAYQLHRMIKRAAKEDLLQIAEGEYGFGNSTYTSIGIQGSGRTKTTLHTEPVIFCGRSALMDCTIEYLRYKKAFRAISVEGSGSVLQLQNVNVRPVSSDAAITLVGKVVADRASRKGVPEVRVGPGATLWVNNSSIGSIVGESRGVVEIRLGPGLLIRPRVAAKK